MTNSKFRIVYHDAPDKEEIKAFTFLDVFRIMITIASISTAYN
tara:strand:- start:1269 stop:1397 length:129 start_codon:yes stop_codon:yes gene_type:complete